jgi:hypothetical protein
MSAKTQPEKNREKPRNLKGRRWHTLAAFSLSFYDRENGGFILPPIMHQNRIQRKIAVHCRNAKAWARRKGKWLKCG